MKAVIPDTLEGAVILSVIHFVLSFVIIAGIGAILSLFPLLNRFGPKSSETECGHNSLNSFGDVAVAGLEPAGIDPRHLVVIAAAVHEVMGPHRIVRVEPAERK